MVEVTTIATIVIKVVKIVSKNLYVIIGISLVDLHLQDKKSWNCQNISFASS